MSSIINKIINSPAERSNPVSPRIVITLDGRGSRLYQPGETLAGSYWFDFVGGDDIQAVECSILWHTEGKGSEDMGVHAFWRHATDAGDWIDPRRPGRFRTVLPKSPLSYSGILIKIYWSVRVRLFLADGREAVENLAFRLGNLPDVRTLKPVDLS
ncbi:MAG: hypothetical protein LBE12_20065 [Planctomycetaceae bacterium]|jgi:hypothetical protein|nr:hypothetical protein [Planctomycetaceae bacterium]